jgi:thymidine kinase
MSYGKLTVYTGPMFSGKTSNLLREVIWNKFSGKTVHAFKPSKDTRYSVDEVVSHDGVSVLAHNIIDGSSFPDYVSSGSIVAIDEIQFFSCYGGVIVWIEGLLLKGIDVFVVGLDLDSNGVPFETTAYLLAMADEVHKLTAICSVCGAPASKTFKKINNNERIELGSSDLYEARCNAHFI